MVDSLDIDDIEQMCTDIINDISAAEPVLIPSESKNTSAPDNRDTQPPDHLEHSEAPTPAEPLQFVASPIKKTAEVLRRASRSASRSTSQARSRSTSRARSDSSAGKGSLPRRTSSTVEAFAVDMPEELQRALSSPPSENRGRTIPTLYISTPTHRSSARLEKLIKQGDQEAIKRERESTSMGVLSPNQSDNPEQAILEAIRRASKGRGSRSVSPHSQSNTSAIGEGSAPSKPPLHRRVSSNVIIESEDLAPAPIKNPGSEAEAEAVIEKAIRRSSSVNRRSSTASSPPQSPRTQRLESIASQGSKGEILQERENTSVGVVDPTQSSSPEQAIITAFRKASGAAEDAHAATKLRHDHVISANLEPDAEEAMASAIRRASQSSDRPASLTASRRRSSRLESISKGEYTPKQRRKSFTPCHKSSVTNTPVRPLLNRRVSEADRLGSISNTGTIGAILEERENTSKGIISPNLEISAEEAIANAFRRVSMARRKSSINQGKAAELEEIAQHGSPQEIRAKRDSTSVGIPDPTEAKNPEKAIESALKDAAEPTAPQTPIKAKDVAKDLSEVTLKESNPNPKPNEPILKETTEPKHEAKVELEEPKPKESEPGAKAAPVSDADTVYLYVSMATGGRGAMKNFQMAQAILESYKIKFTPVEITMDERARRIWKHRGISKDKKLPAVVRDGEIKLDFEELVAANEDEEVDEIIFEEF